MIRQMATDFIIHQFLSYEPIDPTGRWFTPNRSCRRLKVTSGVLWGRQKSTRSCGDKKESCRLLLVDRHTFCSGCLWLKWTVPRSRNASEYRYPVRSGSGAIRRGSIPANVPLHQEYKARPIFSLVDHFSYLLAFQMLISFGGSYWQTVLTRVC